MNSYSERRFYAIKPLSNDSQICSLTCIAIDSQYLCSQRKIFVNKIVAKSFRVDNKIVPI